jgi:ABC-type nitrate/sulfonate/bicarbonate transport system substrate-binding protein
MKTIIRSIRQKRLGLFVAILLLLFGNAGSVAAGTVKKIRLAYAGWQVGTAVSYIGVDAGIFKKHDLDVEEIPIRDIFSAGVQSLLGVDMLIGFGSPVAILQPIVVGGDLAVIGSHVSLEHYGMGVSPSISTVKDLKGKKVGVSALGTRSDLVARVILRRAGLDPVNDVEVVAAGVSPTRVIAISKDLVQGAPLTPEVAAEAKKLGIKILEVKAVPVVTDLIITTRSFIKREEDTVRRFLKSYAVAIHHLITRREDSLGIIKKYFPANQAGSVEAMYDSFAAQLRPLPDLNTESLQALVDVATVVEQRTKTIKPADVIDQRFLDELKAGKFLKDLYTEKVSL